MPKQERFLLSKWGFERKSVKIGVKNWIYLPPKHIFFNKNAHELYLLCIKVLNWTRPPQNSYFLKLLLILNIVSKTLMNKQVKTTNQVLDHSVSQEALFHWGSGGHWQSAQWWSGPPSLEWLCSVSGRNPDRSPSGIPAPYRT